MRYILLATALTSTSLSAADKPNILWLFAEDTSPWMGCYGDKVNAGHTAVTNTRLFTGAAGFLSGSGGDSDNLINSGKRYL